MARVSENPDNLDDWLTPQEVADLKGWKLDTVRKMVQRDRFKLTKRKGPVTLIHRSALAGIKVRPYNRAAPEEEEK